MQLNIFDTVDEVLKSIAEYFIALANETLAAEKRFSVVLSGGNSPKKLYALLASDAFKNQVDWDSIDFFFGDERYVPQTDAASNFRMVNEVLFKPLNIPENHIFPINTALHPAESASEYWNDITIYFKNNEPRFDLILLGVGDNSHTASLFPHTPVLNQATPDVQSVYIEDQQVYRITLNAPLINLAHNVAFLVYGKEKADAVHHVLEGERNIQEFPAQLIRPSEGNLVWFIDKESASKLSKA